MVSESKNKILKIIKMFSCKLFEGNLLKRTVESIKDVVNNVNIEVNQDGMSF